MGMEVMPSTLRKYVGTLAVWVTLTALLAGLMVHVDPFGNKMFKHSGCGFICTVPSLAEAFLPCNVELAPYKSASEVTVAPDVLYVAPAAANAAAFVEAWSRS
jgi:hypothetical protein